MHIKIGIFILLLLPFNSFSKGNSEKAENATLVKLKQDISVLASDKMQGRLTGTDGETKAAEYIQSRFSGLGLTPYKNNFTWDFSMKRGKQLVKNSYFKLLENKLLIGTEVLMMPYSGSISINGFALPHVNEQDNVWMVSMKDIKCDEGGNAQKVMYDYAKECQSKGASSVVFYNDIDITQDLSMLTLRKFDPISIPVAVINNKPYTLYIKPNAKKDWISIDGKISYEDANVVGKNVVAMINNNASNTIVIGAHYDHLGTNGDMVYSGADNNASGVAALLSLAEMIKTSNLKHYNYLFIAFSGHEQNYQGAISFLKQNENQVNTFNCMLDLEGLGRLSNLGKELFVSGAATSPTWIPMLELTNKSLFKIQLDSSGLGYADYAPFYTKNIPVLGFSTGYHEDYMKPTDDVEKINGDGELLIINYIYNIIQAIDVQNKIAFTKTNDILTKLEKLKTDIGILPDFTFNQNGIRVGTCIANKSAQSVGMKSGDVILKIGDYKIIDFDDYINAINKSERGRETTLVVKRGQLEYKFFMVL